MAKTPQKRKKKWRFQLFNKLWWNQNALYSNSLGFCSCCNGVGEIYIFFHPGLVTNGHFRCRPELGWCPSLPLFGSCRWLLIAACVMHRVYVHRMRWWSWSLASRICSNRMTRSHPPRVFPGPFWIRVIGAGNPKALNLDPTWWMPHEVNLAFIVYSVNEAILCSKQCLN